VVCETPEIGDISMISALSNLGRDEGKAKKLKIRAVELAEE